MTALPGTPNTSVLSRYLAEKFPRSEYAGNARSPGFAVRRAFGRAFRDTDWTVVEYEPGTRLNRSGRTAALLVLKQSVLAEYEPYLRERYDVSRNDEDDPDQWDCLLVRKKAER
jgi:hypothetical protein